jgi:hypothetical protein
VLAFSVIVATIGAVAGIIGGVITGSVLVRLLGGSSARK